MILMNDFGLEPTELHRSMVDACRAVIESGQYVLGRSVREFEQRWAASCGLSHGIGVGNGMDALEISLRALNIEPGDEVITTSMTAFATVSAVVRAGATPVLADIEPRTGLMSLDSAQRCLSSRTRAVLLVHLYGQLRNMRAWQKFCGDRGIYLVEDCAQAHLASLNGVSAGAFGVAGAFSFYPTKNLGAVGDGGMLVTNDQALAERAAMLRNYGQSERYHHEEIGLNSRLDELQAAILSQKLPWLQGFTERRREIALAYRMGISNQWLEQLAGPEEESAHVHHLYVLLCSNRAALAEHLSRCGIQTLIHYPVPVHLQEPCSKLARDPDGLVNAESFAHRCLSIPCHPALTDNDVAKVISALNSFPGI